MCLNTTAPIATPVETPIATPTTHDINCTATVATTTDAWHCVMAGSDCGRYYCSAVVTFDPNTRSPVCGKSCDDVMPPHLKDVTTTKCGGQVSILEADALNVTQSTPFNCSLTASQEDCYREWRTSCEANNNATTVVIARMIDVQADYFNLRCSFVCWNTM